MIKTGGEMARVLLVKDVLMERISIHSNARLAVTYDFRSRKKPEKTINCRAEHVTSAEDEE